MERPAERPAPADVESLLAAGVAVIVGTRDAELRPAVARGWGARCVGPDLVRLCISAGAGSPIEANLAANGRIAVTASRPSSYRTVQLKGTVSDLGPPTDEDRQEAAAHYARFAAEVTALGVLNPGCLLYGDFVAVTVTVDERFDQTPGPGAGAPL